MDWFFIIYPQQFYGFMTNSANPKAGTWRKILAQ